MVEIEPKLGDPIPQNWLEKAKVELRANYRSIKLDEFRGEKDVEIYVYRSTLKVDTIASYKYSECYNNLLKKGFPLKEEMLNTLKERGLWGDKQEEEFETIKEDMRQVEIKVALLRSKPNYNKVTFNNSRKDYMKLKDRLSELITKKTSYLSNTIESKAEEEQIKVKLSLCVKYPDGRLVWDSLDSLDNEIDNNVLMKITNEFISFSLGLTQEIIDNLPDHIFNMVGEGLGN